jgi:hypothetical protein
MKSLVDLIEEYGNQKSIPYKDLLHLKEWKIFWQIISKWREYG